MSEPYPVDLTGIDPAAVDPAEIVGPMLQHRDVLVAAAQRAALDAAAAREAAKAAAERELEEGERIAEGHERAAAHKQVLVQHWDRVIARERAEAHGTFDPTVTAQDAAVAS
jgi:hypothetical protein